MKPLALVLAEPPSWSRRLLGVSIAERSLRSLSRAGVRRALLLTTAASEMPSSLRSRHWARPELEVVTHALARPIATAAELAAAWSGGAGDVGQALLVPADLVVDPRLLRTLLAAEPPAVLVDSAPPPALAALLGHGPGRPLEHAAHVTLDWLLRHRGLPLPELLEAARSSSVLDAAREPAYASDLRREVRPYVFPAPSAERTPLAEKVLLGAAQNGTLDLPAYVHAPAENVLVSRLGRHPVTPNQVTGATAALAAVATACFATGRLLPGTLLALAVGVLDGVDGKLARVKLETTALGAREHALDYLLELSWWAALAWHFHRAGLAAAWPLLALLVGADLAGRLAKASVRRRTGRLLDDLTPFDRLVRLVGGRRNTYVWMLAGGLALRDPKAAYVAIGLWGALTSAVHVARAAALRLRSATSVSRSAGSRPRRHQAKA